MTTLPPEPPDGSFVLVKDSVYRRRDADATIGGRWYAEPFDGSVWALEWERLCSWGTPVRLVPEGEVPTP